MFVHCTIALEINILIVKCILGIRIYYFSCQAEENNRNLAAFTFHAFKKNHDSRIHLMMLVYSDVQFYLITIIFIIIMFGAVNACFQGSFNMFVDD